MYIIQRLKILYYMYSSFFKKSAEWYSQLYTFKEVYSFYLCGVIVILTIEKLPDHSRSQWVIFISYK